MSKSNGRKNGKQPRFFTITFAIEGVNYWVCPLSDLDPSIARKAYRLKKRDGQGQVVAVYDVRQTPEGHVECDCKGFLRWGHCKHQETLQAAGMLDRQPTTSAVIG